MYQLDNKENDSKTNVLNADKLQTEEKNVKPRRSVLKEFDPFAPDSPLVNRKIKPFITEEEEHFEDAQSSLSNVLYPPNKTISALPIKTQTNCLIPELQGNENVETQVDKCEIDIEESEVNNITIDINKDDSHQTLVLNNSFNEPDAEFNATFDLKCVPDDTELNRTHNVTVNKEIVESCTGSSEETINMDMSDAEKEMQSNKEVQMLTESLDRTIDVEESAISQDINSSSSSYPSDTSDSLNKTVEISTSKISEAAECIKAEHELNQTRPINNTDITDAKEMSEAAECNKAEDKLNQTRPINKTDVTHAKEMSETAECNKAEDKLNQTRPINKTNVTDAKERVQPNSADSKHNSELKENSSQHRISCRPSIRLLRNKTQIISKETIENCKNITSTTTTTDLDPTVSKKENIDPQILDDYKKKYEDMLNQNNQLGGKIEKMTEENKLKDGHLTESREILSQYNKMIKAYEQTIVKQNQELESVVSEYEKSRRLCTRMEMAFSDLIEKNHKTSSSIEIYKKNEETYLRNLQEASKSLSELERKNRELQEHCKQEEGEAKQKNLEEKQKLEGECGKLQAIVKRLEIKILSLEASLKHKTEECNALSALFDDVTRQA